MPDWLVQAERVTAHGRASDSVCVQMKPKQPDTMGSKLEGPELSAPQAPEQQPGPTAGGHAHTLLRVDS